MTSRIGNLLRLDELDQLKDSEFKAYLWSLYPVFLYPKPNFKNSFNFILRMCQEVHELYHMVHMIRDGRVQADFDEFEGFSNFDILYP